MPPQVIERARRHMLRFSRRTETRPVEKNTTSTEYVSITARDVLSDILRRGAQQMFATVHVRTDRTKDCGSRLACLTMVHGWRSDVLRSSAHLYS